MTNAPNTQWPFVPDMAKMLAAFKVPGLPDTSALAAAQKRNLDAMMEAYEIAARGGRDFAARYAEIMQKSTAELAAAMSGLAGTTSADALVQKQIELLNGARERAVANLRDLSETVQKASAEAIEVLNKRFAAAIEEASSLRK